MDYYNKYIKYKTKYYYEKMKGGNLVEKFIKEFSLKNKNSKEEINKRKRKNSFIYTRKNKIIYKRIYRIN
jgi:hypothetical protein